jgi:hypothetical protein
MVLEAESGWMHQTCRPLQIMRRAAAMLASMLATCYHETLHFRNLLFWLSLVRHVRDKEHHI